MDLSAIILTHNNRTTIRQCLKGLAFCDEIIIVDDFSQDETLDIVKKFKITFSKTLKLYQRLLESDFASQRNFGLAKATSTWILFLDADETVTKELRLEILKSLQDKNIKGFYIKRQDKFLGKILKYGETSNVYLLRLAQKNSGVWLSPVHEIWDIKPQTKYLKASLIHHRDLSVNQFLNRINWYSELAAQSLYQKKIKESSLRLFLNPIGKFFYNYLIRQGFRDGFPGLIMAYLMSWHSFLVRIRLRLLWLNK